MFGLELIDPSIILIIGIIVFVGLFIFASRKHKGYWINKHVNNRIGMKNNIWIKYAGDGASSYFTRLLEFLKNGDYLMEVHCENGMYFKTLKTKGFGSDLRTPEQIDGDVFEDGRVIYECCLDSTGKRDAWAKPRLVDTHEIILAEQNRIMSQARAQNWKDMGAHDVMTRKLESTTDNTKK